MARSVVRARLSLANAFLLAIAVISPAVAKQSSKKERARLVPRYEMGETLRYDIQLRMKTRAHAAGPIVDPEGATEFDQSVGVVLRLDVISVAKTASGPARLRATYEKVSASNKSNSYDPNAEAIQHDYYKLQGRSIEFTLQPDGRISDVKGLEDVATDPARATAMNQWLSQITLGASVPQKGIAIGEKWTSTQRLDSAPVTGVEWRTESLYQGNEPCAVPGAKTDAGGATKQSSPAAVTEECAVILTKSETRDTKRGGDRTPAVYKKNGLRTSGEWQGTGETLTAISLRTGMVVSVTQNGKTHTDFTVTAAATGNHVQYTDDTQSEVEITLLPGGKAPQC